jgi:hypothetical protein
MIEKYFIPYKEMIARCIESCISQEQLFVCQDMIDRFNEQFQYCIDTRRRAEALDELSNRYRQKHAELNE